MYNISQIHLSSRMVQYLVNYFATVTNFLDTSFQVIFIV